MNLTPTSRKWDGNPAADRDKFIGGSDMGTILGMNPWKSAYTLWAEKTGLIETPDISENEAVWWGNYDEQGVALRFSEKTGKKVHRSLKTYSTAEYPFMVGHVDRLVVGEDAGLECKTTSGWNKTDFENGDIPPMHYAQCQLYMMVTGYDYWYYAVKRDNNQFYMTKIARNNEWIEQTMIPAAVEFWKHVQDRTAPYVDGSESTAETLAALYPGDTSENAQETALELDSSLAEQLAIKDELTAQIKVLKASSDAISNQIKAAMGNYPKASAGQYSISWTRTVSNRLDTARLKKERPDIYEHYSKQTETERFTYRKVKEKK